MEKPIVSVVMITYGHEDFIKEAIEGVFLQQTNFDVELIISNDSSPDNSDEVIRNLIENAPSNINVNYIFHTQNIGMMPNFISALQNANGKYIAVCEGDDYWTDPLKLQKQIDFLQANPDYSISFHKVTEIDEKNIKLRELPIQKLNSDLIINDLAKTNFIPTLSTVFRNYQIDYSKLRNLPIGDYPLHLLNASKGKIKFHDENMGVYRTNVGVFSTAKKYIQRQKIFDTLEVVVNQFNLNDEVNELIQKQKLNLTYYIYKDKFKIDKAELKSLISGKEIYSQIPIFQRFKFMIKSILNR